MDRARIRATIVGNNHDDLVILATSLNHELVDGGIITTNLAMVTGLEVVHESITQHQAILADVQLNGVAGVSGGTEVSEGSGGHVFV